MSTASTPIERSRFDIRGAHLLRPAPHLDRSRAVDARRARRRRAQGRRRLGHDDAPLRSTIGRPEHRGRAAGDPRHDLPGHSRAALHGASRRGHGALPRGVRRQGPLVQPLPRGQHPEPRGRSVDRLRHPRARVHRSRDRPRPGVAGRSDHPHAADAADGDHRLSRGDSRRARLHPPGRLRTGRDAMAGRSPPGDPRGNSRASPPARSSPSRGRSARPRRS